MLDSHQYSSTEAIISINTETFKRSKFRLAEKRKATVTAFIGTGRSDELSDNKTADKHLPNDSLERRLTALSESTWPLIKFKHALVDRCEAFVHGDYAYARY